MASDADRASRPNSLLLETPPPEREPLRFDVQLVGAPPEVEQLVNNIKQVAEDFLYHWKTFPIVLPLSRFTGPGNRPSDIIIAPPCDELDAAALDAGVEPHPLSSKQLHAIKEKGEFEVPSRHFPGQTHVWRVAGWLQRGRARARDELYAHVARACSLIVLVARDRLLRDEPLSVRRGADAALKGLHRLMDLIFGMPSLEAKDLEKKIREERSRYLVAELICMPENQEDIAALAAWVTRAMRRAAAEKTDAREPPRIAPRVPCVYTTPQRTQVDLRLYRRDLLRRAASTLQAILEREARGWFLHFRERRAASLASQKVPARDIEQEVRAAAMREYVSRVCAAVTASEQLRALGPGVPELLAGQLRAAAIVTSCLLGRGGARRARYVSRGDGERAAARARPGRARAAGRPAASGRHRHQVSCLLGRGGARRARYVSRGDGERAAARARPGRARAAGRPAASGRHRHQVSCLLGRGGARRARYVSRGDGERAAARARPGRARAAGRPAASGRHRHQVSCLLGRGGARRARYVSRGDGERAAARARPGRARAAGRPAASGRHRHQVSCLLGRGGARRARYVSRGDGERAAARARPGRARAAGRPAASGRHRHQVSCLLGRGGARRARYVSRGDGERAAARARPGRARAAGRPAASGRHRHQVSCLLGRGGARRARAEEGVRNKIEAGLATAEARLRASHPILSHAAAWRRERLAAAARRLGAELRWAALEDAAVDLLAHKLHQHRYFLLRDLAFLRDREPLLMKELRAAKTPTREFTWETRIWRPQHWVVVRHFRGRAERIPTVLSTRATSIVTPRSDPSQPVFLVDKEIVRRSSTRWPGWRLVNLAHRCWSWSWNMMFLLGVVVVWCSPLSLRTLLRVRAIAPELELSQVNGTLFPKRSSETQTMWSRLLKLWRHVSKERTRFETEPDTGLLGKGLSRQANRVWNYGVVGGLGSLGLLLVFPIVVLVTCALSLAAAVAVPLWVPALTLAVYAGNALVYDLDCPDPPRLNRWFVLFEVVVWQIAVQGFLQPVAALVVAVVVCPVFALLLLVGGVSWWGLRALWEAVAWRALIRRMARVPAHDSAFCRRVDGPGLRSRTHYQLTCAQAVAAVAARGELLALGEWAAACERAVARPLHDYQHFVHACFGPFSVQIAQVQWGRHSAGTVGAACERAVARPLHDYQHFVHACFGPFSVQIAQVQWGGVRAGRGAPAARLPALRARLLRAFSVQIAQVQWRRHSAGTVGGGVRAGRGAPLHDYQHFVHACFGPFSVQIAQVQWRRVRAGRGAPAARYQHFVHACFGPFSVQIAQRRYSGGGVRAGRGAPAARLPALRARLLRALLRADSAGTVGAACERAVARPLHDYQHFVHACFGPFSVQIAQVQWGRRAERAVARPLHDYQHFVHACFGPFSVQIAQIAQVQWGRRASGPWRARCTTTSTSCTPASGLLRADSAGTVAAACERAVARPLHDYQHFVHACFGPFSVQIAQVQWRRRASGPCAPAARLPALRARLLRALLRADSAGTVAAACERAVARPLHDYQHFVHACFGPFSVQIAQVQWGLEHRTGGRGGAMRQGAEVNAGGVYAQLEKECSELTASLREKVDMRRQELALGLSDAARARVRMSAHDLRPQLPICHRNEVSIVLRPVTESGAGAALELARLWGGAARGDECGAPRLEPGDWHALAANTLGEVFDPEILVALGDNEARLPLESGEGARAWAARCGRDEAPPDVLAERDDWRRAHGIWGEWGGTPAPRVPPPQLELSAFSPRPPPHPPAARAARRRARAAQQLYGEGKHREKLAQTCEAIQWESDNPVPLDSELCAEILRSLEDAPDCDDRRDGVERYRGGGSEEGTSDGNSEGTLDDDASSQHTREAEGALCRVMPSAERAACRWTLTGRGVRLRADLASPEDVTLDTDRSHGTSV
ncbi:hypothetical protein MSG28_003890 [Choristoneura fumiferana]|uniref:Uncharacterized protein n=1 Tax=Choristoneura fumiferana TaxID=7141 RepID=A0ACC0KH63_CHOFU|nr:hypothetical protein MSG28_003890 [Choristoneura fumiferana]